MHLDKSFSHWLFLIVLTDANIPTDDIVKRMAALYNKEVAWGMHIDSLEDLEKFIYERTYTNALAAIQQLTTQPIEQPIDRRIMYTEWGQQAKETIDKWSKILDSQLYAAKIAWKDYTKWLSE